MIPRGLEGFRPLAEAACFAIVKTEPALLSDQFCCGLFDSRPDPE